jgi:hypothetical protein
VKVKYCVHQFNSGLEHCHDRGVLHHNIKGSHLLLDNNGVLKISNFGMASFFDFNYKQSMMSMVVTMWYELKNTIWCHRLWSWCRLVECGYILAELLAGMLFLGQIRPS